jgi:hypothetical protein
MFEPTDQDLFVPTLIHDIIENKLELNTSLQRLIITWFPFALTETYWSELETSPELETLDNLISRKLPDSVPVVRLVVTMLQSDLRATNVSSKRLIFDEFCERVPLRLFPRCESRGIVRCVRDKEDVLLRDPFDLDLLEGTLTTATSWIASLRI